ncbi:MAG: amidohydrolase family protein [Planctomycetes bacterium]|nr:amidohydrolase family protein [Planctomycetota bacterium]
MSLQHTTLRALLAMAASIACAVAQDPATITDRRPVAFTNARILTMSGNTIERGTLVVKNGKIDALGADVTAPAGARIVDGTGMTIMPGLVSAWSRAGLGGQAAPRNDAGASRRGNRGQQAPMPMGGGGGGAQNRAATKVIESIYPKQEVFGDLLRTGITSLALTPQGSAFPGLGALLRPDGKTLEQLTARDDAFVMVTMAREQQTKKLFSETFEKAKKLVEERKKPPEAPKPAEAPAGDQKAGEAKPGEPKPGEAKTEPPKGEQPPKPEDKPKPDEKKEGQGGQGQGAPGAQAPAKKPEAPKDPNLEVLADLLEGKRKAILQIDSAADLLHWEAVAGEVKFPRTLVVSRHDTMSGTMDVVLDQLKAMKCAVLMQPDLSSLPRSRFLTHPAKRLHDAGIEVGFLLGDNPNTTRVLFFRLMELVRSGLPADVALRGVTLVPAKALGIEARTGSLEVGKDADLLVFRGDPLTPTGELQSVWLAGREVPQQP